MKEYEAFIKAAQFLLESFPGAISARKYIQSRISDAAIEKFRLGYFPSSENFDAFLSLVDEASLYKAKLRYDKFVNNGVYSKIPTNTFEHHNVVMPYRDVYGNIVAIVGRTLHSESEQQRLEIPKYKNTSFEKKNHVYGLFESKRTILEKDCVFVVEGQFDCIKAHDSGITNVVAIGSSNLSLYQLALLKRYTNNIYLYLDNDEAGEIGTQRAISKFGKYASIKGKKVPVGYKDLDDLLRDYPKTTCTDLMNL